jgi:uncharacterized protein (TIGR02246 family)
MTTTHSPAPTIEDTTVDHADDIDAIRRVVADVETGFNTNDPALSIGHFARNASAGIATGAVVTGLDALTTFAEAAVSGPLRDEHARYEVDDVVFVRSDVALARKRAWATTPDGEPLDVDHAMVALYVMVKEDGHWWIAARQNTVVAR